MKSPFFVCMLLFSATSLLAQELQSFRTDHDVVYLGDNVYDVLAKMGEPTGKVRRQQEFLFGGRRRETALNRKFVKIEHWLYNFGSRRFTYIFTFRNNQLVGIEQDDYGFDYPDARNCNQYQTRVEDGDLIPEVLMKCGEPSFETSELAERWVETGRNKGYYELVETTQWIYNFGPNRQQTYLVFENGCLVDFSAGRRGY